MVQAGVGKVTLLMLGAGRKVELMKKLPSRGPRSAFSASLDPGKRGRERSLRGNKLLAAVGEIVTSGGAGSTRTRESHGSDEWKHEAGHRMPRSVARWAAWSLQPEWT